MQSLNLDKAAKFLQMNPEVLRRKAKLGTIPGRKAGKKWVFIKEHLADWVSGRYPETGLDLRVIDTEQESKTCQSTSVEIPGGYNSPTKTEKKYNDLLALK